MTAPNEDQLAIQEMVRKFAREEVAPAAPELDKTGEVRLDEL